MSALTSGMLFDPLASNSLLVWPLLVEDREESRLARTKLGFGRYTVDCRPVVERPELVRLGGTREDGRPGGAGLELEYAFDVCPPLVGRWELVRLVVAGLAPVERNAPLVRPVDARLNALELMF